ncbi:hypothetical protein SAKG22_19510 [Staphylococcus aureus]|nr:hypothetical protein SAKG22_19510 [Staphylococcus aureus]
MVLHSSKDRKHTASEVGKCCQYQVSKISEMYNRVKMKSFYYIIDKYKKSQVQTPV